METWRSIFLEKLRGMTFGAAGITGIELIEVTPEPDMVANWLKIILQIGVALGALIQMFRNSNRERKKKKGGI